VTLKAFVSTEMIFILNIAIPAVLGPEGETRAVLLLKQSSSLRSR
jgi:hypothetical protein